MPSGKFIRTSEMNRKMSLALTGKKKSPAHIKAMSECRMGEKSHRWKGDNVKYSALHCWVHSRLGMPNYCEECKRTDQKRYEWANISRLYKRDVKDWKRLCRSCHCGFDDIGKKILEKRSKNNPSWLIRDRNRVDVITQKTNGS